MIKSVKDKNALSCSTVKSFSTLLRRSSSFSRLVLCVTCCFEIPIHQESIILKTLTNYILSSQAFASYFEFKRQKESR